LAAFIATAGVGSLLGSLLATAILVVVDAIAGRPVLIGAAASIFPYLLVLSAPLVTLGLVLFGLTADRALRAGGNRLWAHYAAAGALGGAAIGFLIARVSIGGLPPPSAGLLESIGAGYGLATAVIFWLVFRRGRAPAGEAEAT
jgi:hypothetical protein